MMPLGLESHAAPNIYKALLSFPMFGIEATITSEKTGPDQHFS